MRANDFHNGVFFGPLFAVLYPLTQLYQVEEDRARGDRTLAILLGERNALRLALGMSWVAFLLLLLGVLSAPPAHLPGWTIIAVVSVIIPALGWQALLLRWLRRYPTMSPADHKRGMYSALQLWALTDIALLRRGGSLS